MLASTVLMVCFFSPQSAGQAAAFGLRARPLFAKTSTGLPGLGLLADMTGDGVPDLVRASSTFPDGYYVQTFLQPNDGHGVFGPETTAMPAIQGHPRALAVADIDLDGDQDLLVGCDQDFDGSGWGIHRMFQEPGGTFTHPEGVGTHLWVGEVYELEAADLDGDGDSDLAYGTFGISPPEPEGLALNDGSGNFVEQTFGSLQTTDLVLFDLDSDGDLEVLWVGESAILIRRDAAGWTDVSSQLPFTSAHAVAAGDVDLDGDSDLVVGDASTLRLFGNQGAGSFGPGRVLATNSLPFQAFEVALVDLEDDGDLDLLSTLAEPFENEQGRLRQGEWKGKLIPEGLGDIALADVDQDGDIDMVGQNRLFPYELEVHTNLARQLRLTTQLRIGQLATLEHHGPRQQAFVLYSSQSTASILVPGKGRLLLGSPLTTLATGALDTRGRASVTALVPNQPSLIGTNLYLQALVGNRPRFTDRESGEILP
jgi:hypothetical protein